LKETEENREIKGISKQINPTKASQVEKINLGRRRTQCIPYESSKKKQASGGEKTQCNPFKISKQIQACGKLENQAQAYPGTSGAM
jgi:hypothetical protein